MRCAFLKKTSNDMYKRSVAAAALLTCLTSVAVLLCKVGGFTLLQDLLRGGFFIPTLS